MFFCFGFVWLPFSVLRSPHPLSPSPPTPPPFSAIFNCLIRRSTVSFDEEAEEQEDEEELFPRRSGEFFSSLRADGAAPAPTGAVSGRLAFTAGL